GPEDRGLDDHLPPDRIDGGAAWPPGVADDRRDEDRPLPGPDRGGGALLLARQRLPLRGEAGRAALPRRRCQPVRRRAADVLTGRPDPAQGPLCRAAGRARGADGPALRPRLSPPPLCRRGAPTVGDCRLLGLPRQGTRGYHTTLRRRELADP